MRGGQGSSREECVVFESLKRLFEDRVAPAVTRAAPGERERGLRLAAAALLFEVVRADGLVKDDERTVMRASAAPNCSS